MKEEERIGKLKASLESLIEDYLGKDINNYQKLGVKEFIELVMETLMKSERKIFLSEEEEEDNKANGYLCKSSNEPCGQWIL
jgi:hypothetical protein